jgi:hypothetical protein
MSLRRRKKMRKKQSSSGSPYRARAGDFKHALERQVNSAEALLADVTPEYDYDTIAFETAEAYANEGGRFAFSLFEDVPSRSQEYEEAAVKALTAALNEIP